MWEHYLPLFFDLSPLRQEVSLLVIHIQSVIQLARAVVEAALGMALSPLHIAPRSVKAVTPKQQHQVQALWTCAAMHSCPLTLFLVQGGQKDINLAWVKQFIRQLRHTQNINPSARCRCAGIGQTVLCPYPIPPRTCLVVDSHRTGMHMIQTYRTSQKQSRARQMQLPRCGSNT